jgi:excinuclease ABC subunit C
MPINLKTVPQKPGVYLFKDKGGGILYIGKASSLKSRVASYFQKSSFFPPHKQLMIEKIKKVEYIITSSETEALLLESNLIKKHQPPYNIDLKDDKNFLYIKITVNENFPRVFTVRNISKDKAKYFGPCASATAVRGTLRFLRKLFPHRNFPSGPGLRAKGQKNPSPQHLQNLLTRYPQLFGPTGEKEYRENIARIIQFLKGRYGDIITELKRRMDQASSQKKYEQAANLRDKIRLLTKVAERQKVISPLQENQDIISLARNAENGAINLFNIRQGALINKQNFLLKNIAVQSEPAIIQAFIEQYYPLTTDAPNQIIVPVKLQNKQLLEKAFGFKILTAERGLKRQYLELGRENATAFLNQTRASWQKNEAKTMAALKQFQKYLKMDTGPGRIEVFDISNIQGVNAVASMIVFTDGQPDKKWYRKFKIKTVTGANDTAMMAEVIKRRFARIGKSAADKKSVWPKPDLVILDGGKGQLNSALPYIPKGVTVAALAKRQEDVYLPGEKNPLNFPANSPALFLIERLRDEAHRFAITFYRKIHQKSLKRSALDEIPGLGPKTKKLLIKNFGSTISISQATEAELAKLVGNKMANQIKENL